MNAELGIELAYPTQRLLVEEAGEEAWGGGVAVELRGPPEQEGARRAKNLFADTYGDPPKERGPVIMEHSSLVAGFDDDGGGADGDGD